MSESNIRSPGDRLSENEMERLAIDEARAIAEAGKTFEYIFGVWQKRHDGDAPLGSSLGSQSVSNTKGIHVLASGDGGYREIGWYKANEQIGIS